MSEAPDLPPIRPFASRLGAVAVSFGLVAAYMAVRSIAYALFPAENSLQWITRDTVMNVPRLFFLFMAWRYGRRLWQFEQLGFHGRKLRECAAMGSLLCVTVLARPAFFPTHHPTFGWLAIL